MKSQSGLDISERFCKLYYCETSFSLPFLLLSLEGWCQASTSGFSCDRLLELHKIPQTNGESRQSIACLKAIDADEAQL